MLSTKRREIVFNVVIFLVLVNIFLMYDRAEIDLSTTLFYTSIVFFSLYLRLLFEIYLLRKEL